MYHFKSLFSLYNLNLIVYFTLGQLPNFKVCRFLESIFSHLIVQTPNQLIEKIMN